jgi:hypothetical protein
MKRKIYLTIAILSFTAIIATVNVNLAKRELSSSLLAFEKIDILAFGESFSFNGTEWNTDDTHLLGSNWKPVTVNCTGYDRNWIGQISATWDGQEIQCQNGNGNCVNGTGCIGNPAQ